MNGGPYRASAAPSSYVCPRCDGVALSRRAIGHVAVDECPRCAGVFVARDTLPLLVEDLALHAAVRAAYRAGTRPAPEGGPLYVRCPVCRELMLRRLFAEDAKVIVDVCTAHGTWFDARELPRAIDYAALQAGRPR